MEDLKLPGSFLFVGFANSANKTILNKVEFFISSAGKT
jgi:hypothetical protein